MARYKHIILGGTFDHLHKGHRHFLNHAVRIGKKITIGITSAQMVAHKQLCDYIEPYDVRKSAVEKELVACGADKGAVRIIQLHDIYGTSLTDTSIDAIVVTPETRLGASAIQKKRKEIGMRPLIIHEVPFARDDAGEVISSERIRYGDINREGKNYYKHFIDRRVLYVPEDLKIRLREPFGDIIYGRPDEKSKVVRKLTTTIDLHAGPLVIAIGDAVTRSLADEGVDVSIRIIDHMTRRKAVSYDTKTEAGSSNNKVYPNATGTINALAVGGLVGFRDHFFSSGMSQLMVIEGEEDLLALPAILLAPLQSIVLYGQYNLGIVCVRVTEKKKEKVMELINKFTY